MSELYPVAERSDLFVRNCIAGLETVNLPGQDAEVEKNRGIYLWKSLETLCSKERRNAFLARCEQENISLVYCYFSMEKDKQPFLQKFEPEYSYFIEECRRRNIRIFALIGELDWLDPAQRGHLRILLNSFLEFNRQRISRGSYGFDGLSLDVEPHSAPGWHSGRRDELIRTFSKQAENQFSCSRPRVTGLLNICTRLLYSIKPKTVFKIIWGRGATPHFKVVQFFMNLAENFSR